MSTFYSSTAMCSDYWQLGYTNLSRAITAVHLFAIHEVVTTSSTCIPAAVTNRLFHFLRCARDLYSERMRLCFIIPLQGYFYMRFKGRGSPQTWDWKFKWPFNERPSEEISKQGKDFVGRFSQNCLKSQCQHLLLKRDEVIWQFKIKLYILGKSILSPPFSFSVIVAISRNITCMDKIINKHKILITETCD
jgi:hypothetical protein